MTRFELATPRPPDVYSNRTELHPELLLLNADANVVRFFLSCKFFADLFAHCPTFRIFAPINSSMTSKAMKTGTTRSFAEESVRKGSQQRLHINYHLLI